MKKIKITDDGQYLNENQLNNNNNMIQIINPL